MKKKGHKLIYIISEIDKRKAEIYSNYVKNYA